MGDVAWQPCERRLRFLTRDGRLRAYMARVATGEERSRLWALVNDLYDGYAVYQVRADSREIPVVVLEPRGAPQPAHRSP